MILLCQALELSGNSHTLICRIVQSMFDHEQCGNLIQFFVIKTLLAKHTQNEKGNERQMDQGRATCELINYQDDKFTQPFKKAKKKTVQLCWPYRDLNYS